MINSRMANIKSAIKRIAIAKRNNLRNKEYDSKVKTFTKKYLKSLVNYKNLQNANNFEIIIKNLNLVYSKLDKAAKVKVINKNAAARKKSALQILLNKNK